MRNNRKEMAKIFFVVFVISLIFSYAFIIMYFDHECIGHDCNLCYEIRLIKDTLDNLLVLSLAFYAFDKLRNYITKIRCFGKRYCFLTSIKLKVELLE